MHYCISRLSIFELYLCRMRGRIQIPLRPRIFPLERLSIKRTHTHADTHSIHWWSHADRALPAGRRVAALTDEHSAPKLWIHASIVAFVESRSKYLVCVCVFVRVFLAILQTILPTHHMFPFAILFMFKITGVVI